MYEYIFKYIFISTKLFDIIALSADTIWTKLRITGIACYILLCMYMLPVGHIAEKREFKSRRKHIRFIVDDQRVKW